jgi:hypothetical protein
LFRRASSSSSSYLLVVVSFFLFARRKPSAEHHTIGFLDPGAVWRPALIPLRFRFRCRRSRALERRRSPEVHDTRQDRFRVISRT